MNKQNNKWIHGNTNLVLPKLPIGFMNNYGIYYLTLTLDKNVGEEVVLVIYDQTDFIYELRDLKPFNFYMNSVLVKTNYGHVFSFIFWVTQPKNEKEAFAVFDKPVDISIQQQIHPWQKIANQTHLHLLLVNKGHEVVGFYEFDNLFGIEKAVDAILSLDATRNYDFEKAEKEYFENYGLEQLYDAVKDNFMS
jgi:hypothetical protein